MSRPLWRGLVAAVVVSAALVGLPSSPVSAHAALESSTPAANSVLEAGPTEIVLDFDEAVESTLADIRLFDGDGARIDTGAPQQGADDTVTTVTVPTLGDGLYAVIWRVTSADGHVVDGAFSFQVGTAGTGDAQDLIDQVSSGAGSDGALTWVYGIARFLSLAGAITLLGAGMWSLQGRPPIGSHRAVRRLLAGGWAVLLAGSAGAFLFFGAQVQGRGLADVFAASGWGDVARTQTGRMLALRVVMAIVLGLLLQRRATSSAAGWWRGASAAAGAITIMSFSMSGHPNSLSPRWWWTLVDMLHLGAITIWLGGLLALAFVGRQWLAEPEAVRPVRRFSFAAAVCVPVIVVTGVAQTLKLAGGLDDITATDWGRMLLTKVMVVVALVAVAGVSRWLLHHDGTASIRRTVVVEAVLGIVVVGLAAGMVAQPPRPGVPSRAFDQTITANGVIASVSISPGHVGSNEVHVLVTPPGGSITPVASASARVSLPSAGVPLSPIELVPEGPNHFSGNVTFPRSGEWTFELVVQVTASDSALLKATVTIP